jgi:hypothetical protein
VSVNDVIGDIADLLDAPLLVAEEVTDSAAPADVTQDYPPESQTWTFYRFQTIKGSVTLRWFGKSNGYYSEAVSFDHID